MKKMLLILAIGAFAACNNTTEEKTVDPVDSLANVIDSTAAAKIDSVQNKSDSLVDLIDSTADAQVDTLIK